MCPCFCGTPAATWACPPGGRCTALAELRDVMPTLLAIAGAPIPGCVDGRPCWTRPRAGVPVRQSLHGEHTPLRADRPIPPITCWRGEYKYIWYSHTGREQLFNLAADPQGAARSGGRSRLRAERWPGCAGCWHGSWRAEKRVIRTGPGSLPGGRL